MKHPETGLTRLSAGFLGLAVAVSGIIYAAQPLRADDGPGDAQHQAARAVRLSSVEGEVHLTQGNQEIADQALANTPIFEGTRIATGDDGRAEIQFEDGSVARLSPDSSFTLTVLKGVNSEARETEILMDGGLAYFELQGDTSNDRFRVRFGDSVITAGGFSVVRLNLDKQPGEVAVFSGNAHIEGGGNPALDLHGGESVAFNATDPNNYTLSESIEPDSWDAWNSDRDQALTTAEANRTTATTTLPDSKNPAWSDLDNSGSWYNVPDQGYVWSPYDASSPGWDPYGDGYWMDTPGFGYRWVSGYGWGYMPYQCGMWNYYSMFGWGWAPGACNPWWGGGYPIGTYINIGVFPPRYKFPVRPRPRLPRPMGGGLRASAPEPIIRVNRRGPIESTALPSRDRNVETQIAGAVVEPLRTVPMPRMPYNHSAAAFNNQPAPGIAINPNTGRPGYVTGRPQTGGHPTIYQPSRSSASGGSRPSGNSGGYRPSAPSGGGGGHVSSGGGGGSHPSGGSSHK